MHRLLPLNRFVLGLAAFAVFAPSLAAPRHLKAEDFSNGKQATVKA